MGYGYGYGPFGYLRSYDIDYTAAKCPSGRCADPAPISRNILTSGGFRTYSVGVGGAVWLPINRLPGRTLVNFDVTPPTAFPSPTPPPGFTLTALANPLTFSLLPIRAGTAPPSPLTYRPSTTPSISTLPSKFGRPGVPGVPSAELVAYVWNGATWRALPRLTGRALPAGQTDGFRVDEYRNGRYVYRTVVIVTRSSSGSLAVFRQTPLPPAPAAAAPVPPPAAVSAAGPPPFAFAGALPKRVSVTRSGRLSVPCLTTPAVEGRCAGRLRTAGRKGRTTVTTASSPLAAGRASLAFRLSARDLRALRVKKRATAELRVTATSPGRARISVTGTVTLVLKRR